MIRHQIFNGPDRQSAKLFDPEYENAETEDVSYMNDLESQLRKRNPVVNKPEMKRAMGSKAYRRGPNWDQPLAGNKMLRDETGRQAQGSFVGSGMDSKRGGVIGATAAIAAAAPIIWPLVSSMVKAVIKRNGAKRGSGLRPNMESLHEGARIAEDELRRELGEGIHGDGNAFFSSVIRKAKGALKTAFDRLGPIVTDAAMTHLEQRFKGAGLMTSARFRQLTKKPVKTRPVIRKLKITEEPAPETGECEPEECNGKGVPSGRLQWGHLVHPIVNKHCGIMLRRSGLQRAEIGGMLADLMDGDSEFETDADYSSMVDGGAFWGKLGSKVKHFFQKMSKNDTVRGIASKLAAVGKSGLDKAIENMSERAASSIGDLGAAKNLEKYTGIKASDVMRDISNDVRSGIRGSGQPERGGYTLRSGGTMTADMGRWIPNENSESATGGAASYEDPLSRLVRKSQKNFR